MTPGSFEIQIWGDSLALIDEAYIIKNDAFNSSDAVSAHKIVQLHGASDTPNGDAADGRRRLRFATITVVQFKVEEAACSRMDVRELNVTDVDSYATRGIIAPVGDDGKGGSVTSHNDVAEGRIVNFAISNSHADRVGITAGQNAVGDGDILAGAFGLEPLVVSTQCDAVVACVDYAVRDGHAAAAIDVNSVVIEAHRWCVNAESEYCGLLAAENEAAPIR